MEDLASHYDPLSDDPSEAKRDVRTKFKLSSEARDAKEWLADYWDMSQKDVAEVVAEITDDFLSGDPERRESFTKNAQNQPGDCSRKTHVVSAATRDFLKDTARELGLSRDEFFDGALRLVRQMIKNRQKEQIDAHKELLPAINELTDHAEEVVSKVGDKVHEDDPLGLAVFGVLSKLEGIAVDLKDEIHRGEPLGPDHEFSL